MLSKVIITVLYAFAIANQDCIKDCCESLSPRESMNYIFYQDTGRFTGGEGKYAIETFGYSGANEGKLNPDMQCVVNTGPLPAALYKLGWCKNVMHETTIRPCSFYLDPQEPDKMCGRNDFFVHGCQCCTQGDYTQPPVDGCSAGCVVIDYNDRLKLRVGDFLKVENYDPNKLNQQLFK